MPSTPVGTLTRRDLLKGAAAGAVALALGADLKAAAAPKPPNIVFILADDLGFADVACYGRPDLHTPHIDNLAANGIRFLQAYANSAVCTSTRVALITGRYQYRLPVGLEEPLAGNRPGIGLPPEHPTLPSLLKKAGYSTTLIGKWHLGVLPKFGPLQSGYEHFFGFRGGAVDYFTHTGGDNEPDLWDGDVPVTQHGYLTTLLGDRAVEVIQQGAKSGQPFFVSLHFNAPHWPWEGPQDKAESDRLHSTPNATLWDFDGGSQKTYQQMIEEMDRQIGRVTEALTAAGVQENTIVIFTSDNGGERFADTWPFTGKKQELLEGGLRIPAIIAWPARLPRGRTTDQVAISMDWLPTLCAAAGTHPDYDYPSDGINLLPILMGTEPIARRELFWRYKANAQRAARDGNFKYLKIRENTFLFNVVDDPLERANLKNREQMVYDRLVHDWFDWNKTMLPENADTYTRGYDASETADHYGAQRAGSKPDNPKRPED